MAAWRGTAWRGVLAGLVVAQGLVITGTAQAQGATVQVVKGQLVVQAVAGQANRVAIAHSGGLLLVDDIVPLSPGPGCQAVAGGKIACLEAGVASISVSLGDLADQASYRGLLPAKMDGGSGADRLTGGLGDDTLSGGSGDDELGGGFGADELTGDLGADDLVGGDGDDVIHGDRAVGTPSCSSLSQPGCSDELHGGAGNDQLYGGEWGDLYRGGDGDDVLDDPTGGGGNILDGGPGDDIIDGASQVMRDVVDYTGRVDGVVVDLAAGTGGEPGEHDTIANVQDIQGGAGDDTLSGNGYNNRIFGNGGFDTINGGGGYDLCVGESNTGC